MRTITQTWGLIGLIKPAGCSSCPGSGGGGGGRHALAQPSDLHLPWTTRTIRAGGVGALRGRPKSQESHTLQRRPCQPVTARPRHRAHGPASHLVAPHFPRHQNVNSSVPLFCHPLFLLSFVSLKKVEEKSFQPSSLFPETRQIL